MSRKKAKTPETNALDEKGTFIILLNCKKQSKSSISLSDDIGVKKMRFLACLPMFRLCERVHNRRKLCTGRSIEVLIIP